MEAYNKVSMIPDCNMLLLVDMWSNVSGSFGFGYFSSARSVDLTTVDI